MGNRFIEKLFVILCDTVAVSAAFFLAFWLRYDFFDTEIIKTYAAPAAIMTVFWIVFYFFNGLYRDWFSESRLDEIIVVSRTIFLGLAIFFCMLSGERIIEAVKAGSIPDIFSLAHVSILFSYGLCLLLTATLSRLLMHSLYQGLYKQGIANQNIAVIGTNDSGMEIVKEINAFPQLGYKIIGFIDDSTEEKEFCGFQVLGKIADIPTVIKERKLSGLIISHITNTTQEIIEIMKLCDNEDDRRLRNVTIYIVPSLTDVICGNFKTQQICSIPLVVLLKEHLPRWQSQIKRIFDIVIAIFALVPFMPVWTVVGLIIKFSDRGPAIFAQERIGKNGKPFIMYKFRSMYTDAEKRSGPQWATKNDPRITPFGRVLRKTRIDEIPQFWNVLKGEMSIVGPRPERQFFIDKLSKEIPWYTKRLKMKPGITGWAQVKHKYDETIEDVKMKVMYDLYYFENMSIILDLKIIIRTFLVIFTGKGAK